MQLCGSYENYIKALILNGDDITSLKNKSLKMVFQDWLTPKFVEC